MNYVYLLGSIIVLATFASTAFIFCQLSGWQKLVFIAIIAVATCYAIDDIAMITQDHLDAERLERKHAKEIQMLKNEREELEVRTAVIVWNPTTGERQLILTTAVGTPEQIVDLALKSK